MIQLWKLGIITPCSEHVKNPAYHTRRHHFSSRKSYRKFSSYLTDNSTRSKQFSSRLVVCVYDISCDLHTENTVHMAHSTAQELRWPKTEVLAAVAVQGTQSCVLAATGTTHEPTQNVMRSYMFSQGAASRQKGLFKESESWQSQLNSRWKITAFIELKNQI